MFKYIEKFLYHTCAYSVIITSIFFAFAKIVRVSEDKLSPLRFFLILGFSMVIALAELIFTVERLAAPLKYLIHFASLFLTFLVVFFLIGNEKKFTPSYVFAALAIFTVIYVITLLIFKLSKSIISRSGGKSPIADPQKKDEYKPRFGGTK